MEDSDGSNGNSVKADESNNDDQEENVENVKQTENKTSTFDFTEQSWRTDFVLIVEGKKLFVAKNILSLVSPVFDTMFQSNFKESICEELELPGKKLNDVIEFLRCVYPSTYTQMTRDSALKVLPLLEEYQVVQHKPRCEAVLLESVNAETDVEELFHLLQEACMYDLHTLREKCVSFASEKPHEKLSEILDKSSLPADAAKEILEMINKSLREVIISLNTSIEDSSRETKATVEQLKSTNAELMEELDIVKQYLSADIKKTKAVALENTYCWEEQQTILRLPVDVEDKCIKSEKFVVIWGIRIRILASVTTATFKMINIEILNTERRIDCQLKVRVSLVNRQPNGLNELFTFEGRLKSYTQKIASDIKRKIEVVDFGNGFVCDGKVGLIVQIYMSKPNR